MTSFDQAAFIEELIIETRTEALELSAKLADAEESRSPEYPLLLQEMRQLAARVEEAQSRLRRLIANDLQGASFADRYPKRS
ncbi:hypothetical protein U879_07175 [Defluviimonas sp. 20V17]|uniref:Uncharacterized protein n=1 Tax=Allgaiera indica TaxID=765699 RepID=A0AAN5A1B0_9RHOB|nr:hypothetical protein [Allgaiera indica]KDB04367.1 hypothetical protein U879_07175 [Defluviimonas sp. 20V17]GHE06039.1 hypothetical protein GCM10008024_39110 [Allgaiera indica]SDX83708.1 hypothetical protein SAMN05444006_1332 [Allgaiera indica]